MARYESDRQLDLLSAGLGSASAEKFAVRWVKCDAPGRLGRAPWPTENDLLQVRDERASVLVTLGDPAELLAPAHALELDVRHLDPRSPERVGLHAVAMAADLRAGRRTLLVGRDPAAVARIACCALIAYGASREHAAEAVGGSVLGPIEHAALRDLGSGR